ENGLNEVCSGNTRLKAFDLCQRKLDRWKLAVDAALASKQWLIAMIHGVAESADYIPSGQESLWIARAALAECLQYALSAGLQARTFQEVYDAYLWMRASNESTGCDGGHPWVRAERQG